MMISFDVKSLFTNIPILEALHVIRRQLESDDTLRSRSTMSTSSVIELLHVCLNTTYFSFEGQYYQQNDGAAMGSSLSPIVTNISWNILNTSNVASICRWHLLIVASWTGRTQSVSKAHQRHTTIHPVYHGVRKRRKDPFSWHTGCEGQWQNQDWSLP